MLNYYDLVPCMHIMKDEHQYRPYLPTSEASENLNLRKDSQLSKHLIILLDSKGTCKTITMKYRLLIKLPSSIMPALY